MHQGPTVVTGEQHLGGPGFAMAVGILARHIDVEGMVRVLDQRDAQTGFDAVADREGFVVAYPAGLALPASQLAAAPRGAAFPTTRYRGRAGDDPPLPNDEVSLWQLSPKIGPN